MKLNLSTAEQVRKAVDLGYKVNADTIAYEVIKDQIGQYLIKCTVNDSVIGLTHQDGTTLNAGNFYINDINGTVSKVEDRYFFEIPDFGIEVDGWVKRGEFDPNEFTDEESECFWDENWEDIQAEILEFQTPEEKLFLEYVNDYLTVEKMALDKGIDESQLRDMIKKGKMDHYSRTSKQ